MAFHNSGGKKGRSGRPTRIDEEDFIRSLNRAWPRKHRMEVLRKIMSMARGGDLDAAKLMLLYWVGKPKEHGETAGPIEVRIIHADVRAVEIASTPAASALPEASVKGEVIETSPESD